LVLIKELYYDARPNKSQNYLMERLAVSHGCLRQMYQLREKKSCRYCCHLWSRPKTFQTTHIKDFSQQHI